MKNNKKPRTVATAPAILKTEQAKAIRGGLLAGEPEEYRPPIVKRKAAKRVTEQGWSLGY